MSGPLEVFLDGHGTGHVSLDGQDLNGVKELHLSAVAGAPPVVVLELSLIEITSLELKGAVLQIPESTAETLVLLGWTPPVEAEIDDHDGGEDDGGG